ncbi:MAG: hypothetical protein V7K25_05025 [Nostoc sp.]
MNLALAQQSLAGLSQTAAHFWEQLTNCQAPTITPLNVMISPLMS